MQANSHQKKLQSSYSAVLTSVRQESGAWGGTVCGGGLCLGLSPSRIRRQRWDDCPWEDLSHSSGEVDEEYKVGGTVEEREEAPRRGSYFCSWKANRWAHIWMLEAPSWRPRAGGKPCPKVL